MPRRTVQTIIPKTLHKQYKPGLTTDDGPIDEKNDLPKIFVCHTAAAIFEVTIGSTNWSSNALLRGNRDEVVLESERKYGEAHLW